MSNKSTITTDRKNPQYWNVFRCFLIITNMIGYSLYYPYPLPDPTAREAQEMLIALGND